VSVETIHAALLAAVADDTALRTVKDTNTPPLVPNLPSAAVWYIGDGQGQVPTQRVHRFGVRLFVALTDLSRAQAQLYLLIATLGVNLEAHRAALESTNAVTVYDGSVDQMQFDELGPMFLGYTSTVTVEPRPAYQVTLAVGADTVTLRDVDRESVPLRVFPQTVVSDLYGYPLVVTSTNQLETVALAGRVDSAIEAALLVDWYTDDTEIAYTNRRGDTLTGWTIAGTPTPRIESRATAAATYDAQLTLWRLP
jgi:hypothetical protein